MADGEAFRETQHSTQWWLWLVVALTAGASWWTFVTQVAFDRSWVDTGWEWGPWLSAAFGGVALPLGLALVHLTTTVDEGQLTLRFWPFPARRIPLALIDSATPVDHHPLRHFGGWGRRWHPTRGSAYSVSGTRGVQLVLTDGRRIFVGSRRAEELASALTVRSARS